jgi:triosephosphate isomerase
MTKYIIANWKSNKVNEEVKEWWSEFQAVYMDHPGVEAIIAPAFVYISTLNGFLKDKNYSGVSLASQDISPFPFGAYTGAVSAGMIKGLVRYAIVGHSERRRYFHETNQDVANKVFQLLEAKITPIVCVDKDYVNSQINAIEDSARQSILIAYEPLEAIGSGIPEKPEEVKKVVDDIKAVIKVPVVYGGSVNKDNAAIYLNVPGVDGLLIGGASLKGKDFAAMCQTAGAF